MQEDAEADRQQQEEHEGERDRRVGDQVALLQVEEPRRKGGERLVAERDLGDAAKQRHGADGDDDRVHAEAGDQGTVEEAAHEADAEAGEDQDRRRRAEAMP